MRLYRRDSNDKINAINRCYFDAEHGWTSLALDRLQDIQEEFPDDPQAEYAEGLIRKDFLGQGLKGQSCFLAAQTHNTSRTNSNENYLFATFNSAKYARNHEEYLQQERIARSLAPRDGDLVLFDGINAILEDGQAYHDVLSSAAGECQEHGKHGDCAAFAELALEAGKFSMNDELALRKARMGALRELDKDADASRKTRGEDFPAAERLALHEAMAEVKIALALDPEDHMLWNFKSAWLYLLDQPEESIVAADKALSLSPVGYIKPMTNKALSLMKMGRKEEAQQVASEALVAAEKQAVDGMMDKEIAQQIIADLISTRPPDDEILAAIGERIVNAAMLTARQEIAQWKGSKDGAGLLKGLKTRTKIVGPSWNMQYVKIVAELLHVVCPETALKVVMELSFIHFASYENCLHAVLYVAAHAEGVMRRDACRFLIYLILGAGKGKAGKIRKAYREAILGSTAVGPGKFSNLDQYMREEMQKVNPTLITLLAEQPSLSGEELEFAKRVTMARFLSGVAGGTNTQHRTGCSVPTVLALFLVIGVLVLIYVVI